MTMTPRTLDKSMVDVLLEGMGRWGRQKGGTRLIRSNIVLESRQVDATR